MVSSTKQTENRRAARHSRAGREKARRRVKHGTPKFPIHPEGYDPKAPDAKSSEQASK